MTDQTFFQWSDLVRVENTKLLADNDSDDYTSRALEKALEFAARGWRIVPCYGIHQGNCLCKGRDQCKCSGKHPHYSVHQGLKGADNRPDRIEQWFEKHPNLNVAIVTGEMYQGPSLLVIDVDKKPDENGRTGFDSLIELEAQFGPLPRTHTVETGSGGLHVFLSYPKGLRIQCSQKKLGSGIDVRADGGYVVAPPSRHKSGSTYKIIQFGADAPPPIPAAWLQKFYSLGHVRNKRGMVLGAEGHATEPVEESAKCNSPKPALNPKCEVPELPLGYSVFEENGKRIWNAVARSMLAGPGQMNEAFTALTTSLKNIPALLGAKAEQFMGIIAWWYRENVAFMSNKEWVYVWRRWCYNWDRWGKPEMGPHWEARNAIRDSGGVAAARRAKDPPKALLASVYRELQRIVGDGDIYLSCRSGSDILKSLGFDVHYAKVNRWQRELERDGVIAVMGKRIQGGLCAQRVRTCASVREKVWEKVKVLMTPSLLKTLGNTPRATKTICARGGSGVEGNVPKFVAFECEEFVHAARFVPPDGALRLA